MSERDNDVDRAAQFEELRFTKGQQWYVATAAVTLLSAIFWIERSISLNCPEKAFATVFILGIVGFGIWFLWKLQKSLEAVRLALDPSDPEAWWRGVDVLFVLAGVVFLAGSLVMYFLWTTHTTAS